MDYNCQQQLGNMSSLQQQESDEGTQLTPENAKKSVEFGASPDVEAPPEERTRSPSDKGIDLASCDIEASQERTRSPSGKGIQLASLDIGAPKKRTRSPSENASEHVPEPTCIDSDCQRKEDIVFDNASDVSNMKPASPASLQLPEAKHAVDAADPSSSTRGVTDGESPSSEAVEFGKTSPSETKRDTVNEQPAKRARKNGTVFSGTDAVAVVLGQTAEIVLVLAGMAQMRAGRPPTPYERELAATAYENLRILVSRVAPNNLVSKASVEKVIQEINLNILAHKMRQDKAWEEALREAEASAKAKEEALATERAEAEKLASVGAAATAVDGTRSVDLPYVGGPPSSGQAIQKETQLVKSPSPSTSAAHCSSQAQIDPQVHVSVLRVDVPRQETEKSMSLNGRPAYKPALGRPPKVRNRSRKDVSPVTLFSPEFLNVVHNQTSEPQKAHVTHKQLCLGVQQFIREHIPPISQTLQALPPTYINTPLPCQVCKMVAKDTGSVLVCDSCDEVSHVKCVQPPLSKGVTKSDWNCTKCLTGRGGGKYSSKFGPIHRGSPNSVKLWPPHDVAEGNSEPMVPIANSIVRVEGENSLQTSHESLQKQETARLGADTDGNQSKDGPVMGTSGRSPHLIVHLVNEASSPTKSDSPYNTSHSLLKEHSQGSYLSGRQLSTLVQAQSDQTNFVDSVTAEVEAQSQGESEMKASGQLGCFRLEEPDEKSGLILEKVDGQSMVEDAEQEATNSQGGVSHVDVSEAVTKAVETKESVDSVKGLPGSQPDGPLPIMMEWVGPSTRRAEGKVYYQSCCVGGIAFSLSDCALFRPETPDVPPYIARLQVLWEDLATGYKWVRVSWCYYPSDIPLAMGHPGPTEPNEVYESNHCDNNLVGSIQGPCFVLPPQKYREEMERRSLLRRGGGMIEGLPPIFLSRWMYDAPKGVFRPFQEGHRG